MYEIGKIYPLTSSMVDQIMREIGLGALSMKGRPDLSRGRRYEGANPYRWAFWTAEQQKIDVSIQSGGDGHAHFLCAFGREADPDCPEPQFVSIEAAAKKFVDAIASLAKSREPKKCIKPDCQNLVAPVGMKNPPPNVFKNYCQTGACQKGHNIYFCLKCGKPHSYASKIGIEHLELMPV